MNEQPRALHHPRMVEAFDHFAGSAASGDAGRRHRHGAARCCTSISPRRRAMRWKSSPKRVASRVAALRAIVISPDKGTYSPKADVREVTLIEQEVLDALARNDPPLQGGPTAPASRRSPPQSDGARRAAQSSGRAAVSASARLILRGGRLNFPCKYLEELLGLPVYLPLYNRSGLNCSIERGGIIRRGDEIELV